MALEPFTYSYHEDQTQQTVWKVRFVVPFNCRVRRRMTSLNSPKHTEQGLPDLWSIIHKHWTNGLFDLSKKIQHMRAAEIIHTYPTTWWPELLGLIQMRDLCLWLKGKHFVLLLCILQHCRHTWCSKPNEHLNGVRKLRFLSIGKNQLWLKYTEEESQVR